MNVKLTRTAGLGLAVMLAFSALASAQELKPIQLPKPQMEGGKPLMQALKERKTTREFGSEQLPMQTLANLLWAAFGINRPETGHRTAPSAMNRQEIDIYVATAHGVYLYDAKGNTLKLVLTKDIRAATGEDTYVKNAPMDLVYVADYSRMWGQSDADQKLYSAADTGFIAQNVYLFCASEGLATVVRGSVNRTALAGIMKLRPDQKIMLAQCVGYPKK